MAWKDLRVHELCQGNACGEKPCFFSASMRRIWFKETVIQLIRTPAAVKSTNQKKTVRASLDTHMYAKKEKAICKATHI